MRWEDLKGIRLGILGAGSEGLAALDAARSRGLAPTLMNETPVEVAGPVEVGPFSAARLSQFDVLIKSPGISLYRPELREATEQGTLITSGTALWFASRPPCQTIAISGTKGKSTVSALCAHLANAAGVRSVVAGNFGLPLLSVNPQEFDLVVVELSSYQTADYGGRPDVALLTNLYPEHLDWHGSEDRYYRDKLQLFAQRPKNAFARARDLPLCERHIGFRPKAYDDGTVYSISNGQLYREGARPSAIAWSLRGQHNETNLLAAVTVTSAAGVDTSAGLDRLSEFQALPHRQQWVLRSGTIDFVDDSIATTPHATKAAVAAHDDRAVAVILGGHDRGLDWSDFAHWIAEHPVERLVIRGANAPTITQSLERAGVGFNRASTMDEAVALAVEALKDGGVVLLSPGAPSYGEYRNYMDRGKAFVTAAKKLMENA